MSASTTEEILLPSGHTNGGEHKSTNGNNHSNTDVKKKSEYLSVSIKESMCLIRDLKLKYNFNIKTIILILSYIAKIKKI
jgi:hypothetical protein